MIWGAVIGAGASLLSGAMGSKASKKAAQYEAQAAREQLAYAKETRDLNRADLAPQREAGYTALDAMMSMTGLGRPRALANALGQAYPQPKPVAQHPLAQLQQYYEQLGLSGELGGFRGSAYMQGRQSGGPTSPYQQYNLAETGNPEQFYTSGGYTTISNPQTVSGSGSGFVAPTENPGGQPGRYNFMADPGYNFRMDEGMRAIERSALARGSYGGGTARQMVRYAQDYASGEYGNVFNRLATIAGYGPAANAATAQSNTYSGQMMANAAGTAGQARASGAIGQGNAWANAINQIGQQDWGSIFSGNKPNSSGAVWNDPVTGDNWSFGSIYNESKPWYQLGSNKLP